MSVRADAIERAMTDPTFRTRVRATARLLERDDPPGHVDEAMVAVMLHAHDVVMFIPPDPEEMRRLAEAEAALGSGLYQWHPGGV